MNNPDEKGTPENRSRISWPEPACADAHMKLPLDLNLVRESVIIISEIH